MTFGLVRGREWFGVGSGRAGLGFGIGLGLGLGGYLGIIITRSVAVLVVSVLFHVSYFIFHISYFTRRGVCVRAWVLHQIALMLCSSIILNNSTSSSGVFQSCHITSLAASIA